MVDELVAEIEAIGVYQALNVRGGEGDAGDRAECGHGV
jgi:hypothetical protein